MPRVGFLPFPKGVPVHHLQFETTVAVVIGLVLVLGVTLIGLLQVATL